MISLQKALPSHEFANADKCSLSNNALAMQHTLLFCVDPIAVKLLFHAAFHGTTATPMLAACAITLLARPSRLSPANRGSLCFILAISYTCFRLMVPTVPFPALPSTLVGPFPVIFSLRLFGPGTFPAPLSLFLTGFTFAAAKRSVAVGGVLSSNVKDRSGRTVTRAGMGVPGT